MFPERLKELRTERRLTQEELASKINVSSKTVGAWERGTRKPPVESVSDLGRFFNVSTDYLLGNSTDRQEVDLDKPGAILRYNGRPIPPDDLEVIKRILRSVEHGDK
ncbi:helix-turn-helix domain-containing protein [Furfurilactobacillus entadae]|uniref:helix-turn-helix domain-containing protein n=1 Tax=Furfurilactobacillus entadae TaxID=2922307 RepID=UPI0035EE1BA3